MKDTIIKVETKKRELIVFAVCLGIAFILNIISIIIYNTPWIEVLTMLHLVLAVAIVLYLVTGIVRILIKYIGQIIGRRNKT